MTLDQACLDVASRNTSVSGDVIKHAERAIDHLRETDKSLRHVLEELAERD